MRRMMIGFMAVALIGFVCSLAQAAPEDDIRATMDTLLQKVVAKDADGLKGLIDSRGFTSLDATETPLKLAKADEFVKWAVSQDVPADTKITKIDTEVWGSVAKTVATVGEDPGVKVFAVLCRGAGKWVLNGVALFDTLADDSEGARVAKEIQQAFAKVSDEGDPSAAIDYLNEDAFVTVASDPAGQSNVFTDSKILRQMLDMVASGGEMTAKFADPVAQGNKAAGFVVTNVDINLGTMALSMRGVFLVANLDGEWVVPLAALGTAPEKTAK